MNDAALVPVEPFSPTVLDEATELRALAQAMSLARGFKLILARCNQPAQRERLVGQLHSELPTFYFQEIHFTEPLTNLFDALRQRIQLPAPNAIFASGLEYSLPNAAGAPFTPFVANLNAARDSFPEMIDCPLVLWIPEYILNAIIIGAPDFFSIRSGVYFFASDATETSGLAQALTVGNELTIGNLTREEKEERINAIESLLTDYQSLRENKRDRKTELRLRLRLANTLLLLGSIEGAKLQYQKLLSEAKELGDQDHENYAYGSLGLIAKAAGYWEEAESYFRRNLETSRKNNDRASEAATLNNLGSLYLDLERFQEAEEFVQESLAIARELGEGELALGLSNLGVVLFRQKKPAAAEKYLRQSLELALKTEQKDVEGNTLALLGRLYHLEGRLSEAQEYLEQSLRIATELGARKEEWQSALNLSLLREQQNDLAGAIDFQRQAVRVLKQMKDPQRAWAEERLINLQRTAANPNENKKQST